MKSVLKIIAATFMLTLPACAQTGFDVNLFGGRSSGDVFADTQAKALADAACSGNSARVASLVVAGANPNSEGADGITPIFWAVQCRSVPGIRSLIQAGANPDHLILERYLPISIAAAYTDSRYLEALLQSGADPNANYAGSLNALTEASFIARQTGSWRNLDILVEYGLDLDAHQQPELGKKSFTLLSRLITARQYCKALQYVEQSIRANEEMLLLLTRRGVVRPGTEAYECQAELDRILLERVGGEEAFQWFKDSR
ncbi:MAG: ankyrin repeat domain-containing protein [Aquisalinus sp.]|nr:ankyrin repeat domain-containing protein [Aquisalinus sp.]